jgi:hypothetical protein
MLLTVDVSQKAMGSYDVTERPCIVVLCVTLKEGVCGWDTTSPLISNKNIENSGHNNSITTKVNESESRTGAGYRQLFFFAFKSHRPTCTHPGTPAPPSPPEN